jgi:O-antigen ligase/tetratricopeptide (TPR) repeat protein
LAAALLITVLISGSDSGRLLTPARIVGAVIGAALILYYIRNAPRRHDRVDLLVLGGLVLFLLACTVSSVPRLSFEAATTALAYVAAFYVAREVVREDPGRSFAIAVLGLLGTTIAITVLIPWTVVWVQWLSVPGAGAPPFNLALPSTQYYPISAAMLIGLLLPATVWLARRRLVWPVGVMGVVASIAVIIMSGSRSLWIAGVAGMAVVWVSEAGAGWTRRLRSPLVIAVIVLGVAIFVLAMPQLAARIVAGSSVDLRVAMWAESLRVWLDSPLTGQGPGSFASSLTLSGFYNSFATYIDHAHSLPVQLLVEAGLVGILGAALVAGAVMTGRRPGMAGSSAALGALAMFVVLSLTADPSVDAFFAVPLIVWAALLAPRAAAGSIRRPRRSFQLLALSGAAIVAVATATTLAAAWSRDLAAAAIRDGDRDGTLGHLSTAVTIDPGNALFQRELGVALMETGNSSSAVRHLERAIRLNPADLAAVRALALARALDGDEAGAIDVAEEAVRIADLHPLNGLTLAFVGQSLERPAVVQVGMIRALRVAPWLLAAPEWELVFPETSVTNVLEAARESWLPPAGVSYLNARARAWLAGVADKEPPRDVGLAAEAEAALLRCMPDAAAAALAAQDIAAATSQLSLQAQLMLGRIVGDDDEHRLATMISLHDRNLWKMAFEGVSGQSPFIDYFADVTVYGFAPMDPHDDLQFPTEASGLSAWLRDPVAAAHAGAPDSPLAGCR